MELRFLDKENGQRVLQCREPDYSDDGEQTLEWRDVPCV